MNLITSKVKRMTFSVISGFCREVAENCALLGYYAARIQKECLFGFLNHEDETVRLSRHVGKKLPLLAA